MKQGALMSSTGTSTTQNTASSVAWLKPGATDFVAADDELTKYLSDAQRMQHVLLLIGSGASMGAGGPSMPDLWNQLVTESIEKAAPVQELVKCNSTSHENIEELLSRCDAWLQIHGEEEDGGQVKRFRDEAITSIVRRCREAGRETEKLKAHLQLLAKMCRRRSRDQRVRIFTTNYDLCIEYAASQLGMTLLDGFSFSSPRKFDPRYLEIDIVERDPEKSEPGPFVPGAALYMKLHGSVNWSEREGATYIEDGTEAASIIYPTRSKYQMSYATPYFDLMSRFLASLRQQNTCLITIGFGFNDDHFTHPIEQALLTNPSFRLVAVNPRGDTDAGAWERFRANRVNGGDVAVVKATLDEFVEKLPNFTALSPGDELVKALEKAMK